MHPSGYSLRYLIVLLFSVESILAAAPRIVSQPQALVARAGEPATLNVVADGAEPLEYTWFFERRRITGATEPTLSLGAVSLTNAGLYWVVVSNQWGRVGSDGEWSAANGGNGHVYEFVRSGQRENDWATMFRQVEESHGYLVSFHSRAEENFVNTLAPLSVTRLIGLLQPPGSPEPTGGWRWMSGESLTYTNWSAGEPNDSITANLRGHENLAGVNPDGRWNDIHGGGHGHIVEYPAELIIYAHPTNSTVSGYDAVALRASVASKRPLTFQWFASGQALPGVNGHVLPVARALEHPGPYFFTVSDGVTTVASTPVEVGMGPLIAASPTNTAAYIGENARLEVSVIGESPFTYQWHRNGVPIPGATERMLVLTNVVKEQSGSYHVEISNAKTRTRSSLADLVVLDSTAEIVIIDNFESSSHPGWSLPLTTVPPAGGRRFLGEFGRETVTLTLTNLPAHEELEISLNVIVRGYWQGNARPDTWRLAVDGRTLLNTTFSTFTTQAFPGIYPGTSNPRATRAVATNTLGYELSFADNIMLEDAVYRVTSRTAHSNKVAALTFSSTLSNIEEAAWSLDNVAVVVTSKSPRLRLSFDRSSGEISLKVAAQPGVTSRIETSTDLRDWNALQTVTNKSGEATLVLPAAEKQRFFRAISQ